MRKYGKCEICDTCFSIKSNLTGHITAVHEGKKPYQCSFCETNFGRKQSLKIHIDAVHEMKKPHKKP